MGVIIRNGNAYGGFDKDFTVVESLEDVESPKVEHLYAVGNNLYYYDNEWIELGSETGTFTGSIEADEDQILVGNGDGWAKGTSFKQLNDETFGAGVDVTENVPIEFGYRDGENFKYGMQIKATPNIPKKVRHWSNEFDGPTMIAESGFIEMKTTGAYQEHWTGPNMSFRGDSLIDICGSTTVPTYSTLVNQDIKYIRQHFNLPHNPNISFSNVNAPMLKMQDSATIIMEKNSLVQMKDDAIVEIGGASKVQINGYYSTLGSGSVGEGPSPTEVIIGPGSHFKMSGYGGSGNLPTSGIQSTPYFCIEKDHIIMAALNPITDRIEHANNISTDFRPTNVFDGDWRPYMGFSEGNEFNNVQFAAYNTLLDKRTSLTSNTSNFIEKITCPYTIIEGKTHLSIGDGGAMGVKIGPKAGGSLGIDFTPDSGSYTYIKAGSGSGSSTLLDLTSETGSYKHIKIGARTAAHADVAIEFGGNRIGGINSIKFAPAFCVLNYTPTDSDVRFQWGQMLGTFNGDGYITTDNLNHVNLSGSIVSLRSDTGEGYQPNIFTDQNTYTYVTNSDLTNKTQTDLFTINGFSSDFTQGKYTKYKNIQSFDIVSLLQNDYVGKEYDVYLDGLVCDGDIIVNVNTDRTTYTWSQLSSDDYYQWYVTEYGMSKNSDSTATRQAFAQVKLTNMHFTNLKIKVYLSQAYSQDTPYEDLSANDKLLIQAYIQEKEYTNVSLTNVTVTSSVMRTDLQYDTTISNIVYSTNSPFGHDYHSIIKNNGKFEGVPTLQMGQSSNLVMGNFIEEVNDTISSQEDLETLPNSTQVDNQVFLNSTTGSQLANNPNLVSVTSVYKSADPNDNTLKRYSVSYYLRDRVEQTTGCPVLEMQGDSNLTLLNVNIKGYIQNDTPTYEFSCGESSVTFTLSELQQLKQMLS